MENLSSEVLIMVVTIIVAGLSVTLGTMVKTWMEGKVAEKAIEGMTR